MNSLLRIATVGDYNPDVVAHKAIPTAIDDAAAVLELPLRYDWLATSEIKSADDLADYDAIWVVPASPYKTPKARLSLYATRGKTAFHSLAPAEDSSTRLSNTRATLWAGGMPHMRKPIPKAGWLSRRLAARW